MDGPTPAKGFVQECEAKGASANLRSWPPPKGSDATAKGDPGHRRGKTLPPRGRLPGSADVPSPKEGPPRPRGPTKEPPTTETPTSVKPPTSGSTAEGDQHPRPERSESRPRETWVAASRRHRGRPPLPPRETAVAAPRETIAVAGGDPGCHRGRPPPLPKKTRAATDGDRRHRRSRPPPPPKETATVAKGGPGHRQRRLTPEPREIQATADGGRCRRGAVARGAGPRGRG